MVILRIDFRFPVRYNRIKIRKGDLKMSYEKLDELIHIYGYEHPKVIRYAKKLEKKGVKIPERA